MYYELILNKSVHTLSPPRLPLSPPRLPHLDNFCYNDALCFVLCSIVTGDHMVVMTSS